MSGKEKAQTNETELVTWLKISHCLWEALLDVILGLLSYCGHHTGHRD